MAINTTPINKIKQSLELKRKIKDYLSAGGRIQEYGIDLKAGLVKPVKPAREAAESTLHTGD